MWCEFLLTAVCLLLVMVVASQGRLGMEGLQEWCSSNHVKVVENLSCQLGGVEVELEVEVDEAVPSQPRDAPVPLLSQILTLCVSGAPVCQQCWDLLTVIHPGSNNCDNKRDGVLTQDLHSQPDHHPQCYRQYCRGSAQLPGLLHPNWRGAEQILPVLQWSRWAGWSDEMSPAICCYQEVSSGERHCCPMEQW